MAMAKMKNKIKLTMKFKRELLFSRKVRKKNGFTLVELMVVIVILGALMGMLLFLINDGGYDEKLVDLKIKSDNIQLKLKLEDFKQKCGRLPTSDEGLIALAEPPADCSSLKTKKLDQIIKDKAGCPYQYELDESGTTYKIKHLGKDCKEGGEEENQDRYFDDIVKG